MDLRVKNGGAEPPPPPAPAPPAAAAAARGGEGSSIAAAASPSASMSQSAAASQGRRGGGSNNPNSSLTSSGMFSSVFAESASRGPEKEVKRVASPADKRLAPIFSGEEAAGDGGGIGNGGGGNGIVSSKRKKRRKAWKKRSPWLSAPMILGSEVASNIAYYSISTNMVIYLRAELGYMPDKAALVSSALIGSSYIAVLGGGIVADGVLGRAVTVLASAVTYTVGLALLTLSAFFVERLRATYGINYGDKRVAEVKHGADVTLFYVSMVLLALATGGIKPNVSPLGADQFDDFDAKTGAPLDDKSVFFGWYYFFINIGALLAATVLVWVQTSGRWTLGFAIPTAITAFALIVYALGWRGYCKYPPGGPPLNRVFKVLGLAIKNRKAELPEDPLDLYEADMDEGDLSTHNGGGGGGGAKLSAFAGKNKKGFGSSFSADGDGNALADGDVSDDGTRLLEDCGPPPPLAHTESMRWLDRAAVVPPGVSWPLYGDPPPKGFVPVSQVEETKQLFRIMPIWATLIIWNLGYAQLATIMVQQAESMNRKVGKSFEIPPASVSVFATATILILVPFWDRVVRPLLEKRSWSPTTLQRMGLSHVLMAVSFVFASIVEFKRTSRFNVRGKLAAEVAEKMRYSDTSVFWIAPQIVIMGVSEFFFIGAIEFFYQQSPERMRSLAAALELVAFGIASYFNTALISVVGSSTDWLPGDWADGNSLLEYYYLLIAGLCVLNLLVFLWPIASKYTYREFEPPKRSDVTVAFGRSVAGLHASKAVARPLSATLSRAPTIKPYATSAALSMRLQRAATSRTFSRPLSTASSARFGTLAAAAAAAAAAGGGLGGSGAFPSLAASSADGAGGAASGGGGGRVRSSSLDEERRRRSGSFEGTPAEAAAAAAASAAAAAAAVAAAAAPSSPAAAPAAIRTKAVRVATPDGDEHLGPLGIPSSASARRAAEHTSPLACAQEGEEGEEEEEGGGGEKSEKGDKKKPPSS